MSEREIICGDGSRWRVMAPSRASPARLDLVFESLDGTGLLLRGEATASDLSELSDRSLCFLLGELREADRGTS